MAEPNSELAGEIVAACTAQAEAIAVALGTALDLPADTPLQVAVQPLGTLSAPALAGELNGPGLAVVFKFGTIGVLALLAEANGLLPAWYAAPDAVGQSKLATLAQDLGKLLVPAAMAADECRAGRAENLATAIERASIGDGAEVVPLLLTVGERQATLHVVWRCGSPDGISSADNPAEGSEANAVDSSAAKRRPGGVDALPGYTRSLLKIRVPVVVQLATKKQSIEQILELGAGSIIKFEKSCDEMLDLEIGGWTIARGEAVKVGDKFGLRIHSMVLPGERFNRVERT